MILIITFINGLLIFRLFDEILLVSNLPILIRR